MLREQGFRGPVAAIGDTILEKGIIFSRYWCKSLIRSKGQVDKM
jgi:hypothetical protein